MAFSLPRLQGGSIIIDKNGRPTVAFKALQDNIAGKIEDQEVRQDAVVAELEDAVADLETLTEALALTVNEVDNLTGQMNALLTNYVPQIDQNSADILDLQARVTALENP